MKLEALARLYQDRLVMPLGPRRARMTLIVSSCLVLMYLMIIPALTLSGISERERATLLSKQQEFLRTASEYRAAKAAVDAFEQRPPVPAGSATQTVSELLSLPGTRVKTKSIRSMAIKEAGDRLKEETLEVQIEKLTLNELINVCYRIEKAPARIVLRSAQVKRSFESPDLLEATLTLSLFLQAAQVR